MIAVEHHVFYSSTFASYIWPIIRPYMSCGDILPVVDLPWTYSDFATFFEKIDLGWNLQRGFDQDAH